MTSPKMETVISADGTSIAYKRTGSGPPLILVHGSGAVDSRYWTMVGVTSKFADYCTVLAIDRRGRGGSGDGPVYALKREFEDVVAVIEAIDEPVNLLGHSFGGIVALEAVSSTRNVARLILYEPFVTATCDAAGGIREAFDEVGRLVDRGEHEAALVHFLSEIASLSDETIASRQAGEHWADRVAAVPTIVREDLAMREYAFEPDRVADINVPTLLLVGDRSPMMFHETAEMVAEALPDATNNVLEDQGHIAMDTATGLFAEEVVGFIRDND